MENFSNVSFFFFWNNSLVSTIKKNGIRHFKYKKKKWFLIFKTWLTSYRSTINQTENVIRDNRKRWASMAQRLIKSSTYIP